MANAEGDKVSKQLCFMLVANSAVSREGSYPFRGKLGILFLLRIIFSLRQDSADRWFWMPVIQEWKCEIE